MVQRMRVLPTVLLPLLVLGAVGGEIIALCRAGARGPATIGRRPDGSASPAVSQALARCEQRLAGARARMADQPGDGPACLQVASLEMRCSNLLALAAYEAEGRDAAGTTDAERGDFLPWRQRFLRADPDGGLTRVTWAAQAALRASLDARSRRRALLLLAAARNGLGDNAGEVEALWEAAREGPDQAPLWLRLADAYGRAGRFAESEAARERCLALLGGDGSSNSHGADGTQNGP